MRYRPCVLALAVTAWALPATPLWAQYGPKRPDLVLDVGTHTAPVPRAVFTRDNKQLITVSRDKTIRFWDVTDGSMLRVLRPPRGPAREGELYAAAVSPDGRWLAVAGFGFTHPKQGRAGPIDLIDVESGEISRLLTGHTREVLALAFSAGGKRLASGGGDKTIRVWDVTTGKELKTLKGLGGPVTSLAFSPDGSRLVSGGGLDTAAWVWSVEKEQVQAKLEGHHQVPVGQVAWSPDGNRLATGGSKGEKFVALWSADGKHFKNVPYPGDYPLECQSLAFTDDSRGLLVSAVDAWRSNVFEVRLPGGKVTAKFVEDNHFEVENVPTGPAALSRDGKLVAVACDRQNRVHVFDRKGTARAVCGAELHQPTLVAWVRDKEKPDDRTIVWRTSPVPKDHKYETPLVGRFFDHAFDLSEVQPVPVPKGKGDLFVRNLWGLGQVHLEADNGGKSLRLYRGKKATDVVLNPRDGALVYDTVTFAGPERVAFATSAGNLDVYDVSEQGQGKRLGFLGGFNGSINTVAPSPDDGHFLVGGGEDQALHVWAIDRTAKGDPTRVRHARLMSLFVAPLPPRPPGARRREFISPDWIAWTPQGFYAASAGGERLMGWHISNGDDKMGTFHPASRFRPQFYRPDVLKLLVKEGSLEGALKAADKGRNKPTRRVEVADVLPPEINVTTKPKAGAPRGTVTVEATAEPAGKDPITSLQLLIDDRPYTGEGGLFTVGMPKAGKVTHTWEIKLPPGPHQVRVLARTEASLGTSRGMTREVEPETAEQQPNLYVLAVGIDAYPPKYRLSGAVNDAKQVEETFRQYSKLPLFEKVVTKRLTDKEATKEGILGGLKWLKDNMKVKDVGVFFYAGHGCLDDANEFYLLSCDGDPAKLPRTAVSRSEIKEQMQGMPGRILVLLDCCHSGAIGLLFDDVSRELMDEDCGVVVMCAARPKQTAGEKDGHGFFTRSVVSGLSGQAGQREGVVYLHHLQQYVVDHVLDLTNEKQHAVAVAPPWMRPLKLSKP
jgi:WD40 repeat protein